MPMWLFPRQCSQEFIWDLLDSAKEIQPFSVCWRSEFHTELCVPRKCSSKQDQGPSKTLPTYKFSERCESPLLSDGIS